MAVVSRKVGSKIQCELKAGIDKNGKDKIKTKVLGNINPNAVDEDAFAVAKAISDILEYPAMSIARVDENALSQN